jgi:hypothetical protein
MLPPVTEARPLQATAAAVGGLAWWSRRLAEVLGSRAARGPEPAVCVLLAGRAAHHAWHLEVLRDRLPQLRDIDRDDLVTPPTPGASRCLEALVGDPEGVSSPAFLGALDRVVVPAVLAACDELLAVSSPVAEGPLLRWLPKVADDLTADQRAGGVLFRRLIASADPTEAVLADVAAHCAAVDRALGAWP